MNITLEFENGNKVVVHQNEQTNLFSAYLNSGDGRTRMGTNELIAMLDDLRRINCVINSWKAIE
jgi:hypothetical protein